MAEKNHGERRNIYQSKGHYEFKRNGNQGFTMFIHKGKFDSGSTKHIGGVTGL